MNLSYFNLSLMIPAFVAGIIVLSIHVPLGQQVLKRGIIFIDLAIAQIAALGVIIAVVLGSDHHGWQVNVFAGISALLGATLIYSLEKHCRDNLEAMIGLLFVLSASGCLLILSFAPHNDILLHDLLVGQILWVNIKQLLIVACLYAVLIAYWLRYRGRSDLHFYLTFSLSVTASVQLVGIYLVFASLILPALVTQQIKPKTTRLITAYVIGLIGYFLGIICSLVFDLPTGVTIVWLLFLSAMLSKPVINRVYIQQQ